MATGALDANGIWQYGEDDSEPTFSGLLNKGMDSVSDVIGTLNSTGRIVNTVSSTRNSIFTMSSTTYQDVPSVSATITPKSSTNKILIRVTGLATIGGTHSVTFRLLRNTTPIGLNSGGTHSAVVYTNSNGTNTGFALDFLDSPASMSSTTYKLQIASSAAGAIVGVGGYTANTVAAVGSITSITVMEVVA